MVMKQISMNVEITLPMSVTRRYRIIKEVDIDEKWAKQEGWDDEEYVEENYEDIYFNEAEKLMDKELDTIEISDLDFEDYTCEFDY